MTAHVGGTTHAAYSRRDEPSDHTCKVASGFLTSKSARLSNSTYPRQKPARKRRRVGEIMFMMNEPSSLKGLAPMSGYRVDAAAGRE